MICHPGFVSSVIDLVFSGWFSLKPSRNTRGFLAALLSCQACFLEQEGKGISDSLVCMVAMSDTYQKHCDAGALLDINTTSLPRNQGPGAAFLPC